MKQRILFAMAFLLSLLTAHAAWAAPIALSATHKIVSSQISPQGTTTAVIDITVSNQGTTPLSGISAIPIGPEAIIVPGTSALSIPSLAAGASISTSWSIEIVGPPLFPGMLLELVGKATDQNGQSVDVIIFSVGVQP